MALTSLNSVEQSTVDDLVSKGRIERVLADANRAATFLSRAAAIADVDKLTHPDVAYNVAYDACHDVGEAVLAAYGYRTKAANGQHEAVGQFLKAVFTSPPGNEAAASYDTLRRARNRTRYAAVPVGRTQVDHARAVAQGLLAAAISQGVGK